MDDLINALADLGGVIAARVSKLLAVLSQNKVTLLKLCFLLWFSDDFRHPVKSVYFWLTPC